MSEVFGMHSTHCTKCINLQRSSEVYRTHCTKCLNLPRSSEVYKCLTLYSVIQNRSDL